MTTPRPGSRAEERRRTEARILDAETQVFFTAGYERATIRAVASAAGPRSHHQPTFSPKRPATPHQVKKDEVEWSPATS